MIRDRRDKDGGGAGLPIVTPIRVRYAGRSIGERAIGERERSK
jgi:hypothetical protein